MNKQELEEIAVSAYSMYNQIILDVDRKNILRAWWEILSDRKSTRLNSSHT